MIVQIRSKIIVTLLLVWLSRNAAAIEVNIIDQFGTAQFDSARAVALDNEGNAFVSGYVGVDLVNSSLTDYNVHLRKYSKQGNLIWERDFGTASRDEVWRLETDALGNVYVGGTTKGNLAAAPVNTNGDGFIRKYDKDGQVQWTRQFGRTDYPAYVTATASLAIALTGDLLIASGFDVRKYDPAGNLIWVTPLFAGPNGYESGHAIAADALGNVFVGGFTQDYQSSTDVDAFITHFDLDGQRGWTRLLSTVNTDAATDLAIDGLGNVFLAGETYGHLASTNAGGADVFIAKFDAAGNHSWSRQFGGTAYDGATGIASDKNGGAFVAGYTNSGSTIGGMPLGSQDAYVCQFNASGNLVWSKRIGTAQADLAFDIATNASGRFIVAGSTGGNLGGTNSGASDAWFASSVVTVAGDHNADGLVDARDYVLWRNSPSSHGGDQGYTDWRTHYGTSSASSASTNVPEPHTFLLLISTVVAIRRNRTASITVS